MDKLQPGMCNKGEGDGQLEHPQDVLKKRSVKCHVDPQPSASQCKRQKTCQSALTEAGAHCKTCQSAATVCENGGGDYVRTVNQTVNGGGTFCTCRHRLEPLGDTAASAHHSSSTASEQLSYNSPIQSDSLSANQQTQSESLSTNQQTQSESLSTNQQTQSESLSTNQQTQSESLSTNQQTQSESLSTNQQTQSESVSTNQQTRLHINLLPQSILVEIFQKLSLADVTLRISRVCKLWNYLCCDPDLWKHIDLGSQMKVTDAVLLRLTSYSGNVTSLDLTDVRLVSDEGLVATFRQCTQLTRVCLDRCSHLTDYGFLALGEYCPHLVSIKMDACRSLTDQSLIKIGDGCPKLRVFKINQCRGVTDEGLVYLVQKCPLLKCIALESCQQVTDVFLVTLARHCLSVEQVYFMDNRFTQHGLLQLAKCRDLVHVELSQIRDVTDDCVIDLVKNCRRLRGLNTSLCQWVSDRSVEYIARHAKNIRYLCMVSCQLTDRALLALADHCKTIETVDFGWCVDITDHGVIAVSDQCPQLKSLGLMRCDAVTVETMQLLVDKYPEITFSTMWLECERLIERARRAGHCLV